MGSSWSKFRRGMKGEKRKKDENRGNVLAQTAFNHAQSGGGIVAPHFSHSNIQGSVYITATTTAPLRTPAQVQEDASCPSSTSIEIILRVKKKLRDSLKEKFRYIFEGTTEDEKTLLDSIFVPLYMTTGESDGVNKEHEIMQIEYPSTGKPSSESPIHCSDIFSRRHEKETKIVLTKGIAGIGKTISVYKFILDWADGISNQDIDFIFVLPFRELHLIKGDFSLHGLLKEFHPELEEIEDYEKFENYKVLFILDGMDESRCPLDFQNNERVSDVTKKCPVDVLLTNLMKKNLLPSALLWITSRPAAASQIPGRTVNINLVTEVRGFSEEQRLEYFRKRFSDDDDLANRIIEHIRTTRSLYIMCYIPIMCWIIAKVLEHMFRENNCGNIPQSLSDMYIHFLITQMKIAFEKNQEKTDMDEEKVLESRKEFILKLGQVAFEQLVKGNVIFYAEDLRKCGIDVNEAAVKCGLCTEILKVERGLYKKKVYCFVHLSFQEFLAALYVFHCCVTKNISALKSFLENVSADQPLHEMLKSVVDKALQSKNGHLDLFLRFLLGISLESNQNLLQGLLPQTENITETDEAMRKYLRKPDVEDILTERQINLFLCLIEMKDSSVHEDINQFLTSPDYDENALSGDQCSALANALLTSQGELDEMDQRKYNMYGSGRIRLIPVVRKCRKAVLTNMELTPEDCASLVSSLQSPDCPLRELQLLDMSGQLSLVLAALSGPHSKLETLRLTNVGLRSEDCAPLVSSLQSPDCPLTELNMEGVHVFDYNHEDGDLSVVLAALRSSHCKLETLRLNRCYLTEDSCRELSSALSSNGHLRELDLSHNDLKDSFLKLLSDGLKSPQCNLKILRLSFCGVTEKGCASLASALSSNRFLRELDLSYNHPGDTVLSGPFCRLKKLNVDHNEEIWVKPQLHKKYACHLRLDPNTAHRKLSLSEDNRRVEVRLYYLERFGEQKYKWRDEEDPYHVQMFSEQKRRVEEDQSCPDHPERFEEEFQVLCSEGLTGRHYWEVEVKGDVLVGVTYRIIRRTGFRAACRLGDNDISWCLGRATFDFGLSKRLCVHHNHQRTLTPVKFSNRVGVYLDWPAGILSFYSVSSDAMTHLYTFNTFFSEPLYPGFGFDRYSSSSMYLCQVE